MSSIVVSVNVCLNFLGWRGVKKIQLVIDDQGGNERCYVSKLTGRLSRVFCRVDFQRVFLGILESASVRGAKSGMLRENGKGNPARDVSKLTLKVKKN